MSQKGGYKLNFVHRQPDNTICSICRLVLCNPMQAERCGHRYCKSCLYDLPKRNGFHICPQDGSEMKLFQDNAKQMEILELLVKCPNNQSGSCNWIKELRHLRVHLEVECLFEFVKCTNFGCTAKMERRSLKNHKLSDCKYRLVCCQYCSHQHAQYTEKSHLKVCTEVPVSCQDCYQDAIPKSRIGIHRSKECTRRKIFEAMEIQLKDQTAEMKKLQDIIRQQKVEIDQHKTENQMLKKKVYHQEQTMSTLKRDQEDMCGKFNRICNVIRK
ncbi:TNF receptor-associated factor 3-like isoform X1 [Clytia hemisphaerica]|uniref:Uncharacterized protein n=1 Tax=Clytia hemisphaerica TaxID=252671 RepID=A0A7M5TY15_9CNID